MKLICRLPPDTPARQSLNEVMKVHKRNMGRPRMTWIAQIKQDLERIRITPDADFENVFDLARDRDTWRATCSMVGNRPGSPTTGGLNL